MRLHLGRWQLAKRAVQKRGSHSRYEADFELRFVLFLAENIDGFSNSEEKAWTQVVAKGFDWSSFHLKQLENRVHQLPSFELDQCRLCRECPPLGALAYQLALSMCWVDGELTADEKSFMDNLKRAWMLGQEHEAALIEDEVLNFFGVSPQPDAGQLEPNVIETDEAPLSIEDALAQESKELRRQLNRARVERTKAGLALEQASEATRRVMLPRTQLAAVMLLSYVKGRMDQEAQEMEWFIR